jgi:DNA-binding NtrC family response regulator
LWEFDLVQQDLWLAAQVDLPVLISGANHRTREMCARIIHRSGRQWHGPFVTSSARDVNAKALLSTVLSTDAAKEAGTQPLTELPHVGTLFVSDVAELDASGQARLFGLVEACALPPVCSSSQLPSACRVVAGASRHLDGDRASGAFSDSLFYRLNVVHIDLTRYAQGPRRARGQAASREGVSPLGS